MKAIPTALQNHLNSGSTTLATCFRLALANGQVYGFTDHDLDLVINDTALPNLALPSNPVTYAAASGYVRSSVAGKNDLSVDNTEIDTVINLSGDVFTTANVNAGVFDFADVTMFVVNHRDLTMGLAVLRHGNIGEITAADFDVKGELLGMLQRLTRYIVRLYIPECDADFADKNAANRCKLDPALYTETGAVTAIVTANHEFTATVTGTRPNGFFTNGLISWTTGANAGLSIEVKQQNGTDFLLPLSSAYTITVGDTFSVLAGCDKTNGPNGCAKFPGPNGEPTNIKNHRGFLSVPGLDAEIAVPGVLG